MRIRQGQGRIEFLSNDGQVKFGEYQEGVCIKCKKKLAWGETAGAFKELAELNLEKMGFVVGRVRGACEACEEDIEKAMVAILGKLQSGEEAVVDSDRMFEEDTDADAIQ
jgi:hypothetical protein